MKVAIIGAGMVGVAAAQAFAAEGFDVTVFERRASVAEESSFAPAGIAASGLAAPWRAPSGRLRTPWNRGDDTPGLHETGAAFASRALLGSSGRGAAQAVRNAERALALRSLIEHGVERIDGLAQKLRLDFERDRGLLVVVPDAGTAAQAELAVEWLKQAGETVEWVDTERQRRLEPGRALPDDAPRAVYLPDALIGNTREWTQLLRGHAQSLGVRFLFQHEVLSLGAGPRPSLRHAPVARDGQPAGSPHEAEFDAVVVCAALDSARLLAPLGVKLPWRAVRGCSITVPLHVRDAVPDVGPRAAVLDVRSGIAITRLGSRVRVAGGHELAPRSAATVTEAPAPKTLQPLYDALDTDFPGAVHWQHAQAWQAARPVLADGLPAVGASGIEGIWMNIGHAHHGWPLSQVAAEALCAMVAKQEARVNVGALSPQRLG